MRIESTRLRLALSVCIVALAVGGCGGGSTGGGGPQPIVAPPPAPPPPPPPPPLPAVNFDDAEYRRSNGAISSGAISAWNAGGRGQGIVVGVVDSGINPALAEFAGRIHPASADIAANRGLVDADGHGTAVTGVIAAARNGAGPMGIAFESTILSLNTANPNNCTPDCQHSTLDIAQAIDVARSNGARVINISLGGDSASPSVVAAVRRAVQAGLVIVMSAGNTGGGDPEVFAGDTAANAGGAQVIIAGAIDGNRALASFSARAGLSSPFYLAALGVQVRTIDQDGAQVLASGTSFSAPVISGAAALLASAFPNLTGAQIVAILFNSADDAGFPGTDSQFGRGILNIDRAFQPMGTSTLAGTSVAINAIGDGEASEAMGDATVRVAGAVILDGYSRAFTTNLTRALNRAPAQRPLAQSLRGGLSTGHAAAGPALVSVTLRRDFTGQPNVGLAQAGLTREDARAARLVAGHMISQLGPRTAVALGFSESARTLQQRLDGVGDAAFLVARDPMSRAGFWADSGVALGARQNLGPIAVTLAGERGLVLLPGARRGVADPRYALFGLTAGRSFGPLNLSLGLVRLEEEATLLGGRFAMAPTGSQSLFLDAAARYALGGGWVAHARYRRGQTRMGPSGSLVAGGNLSTDAWSADLGRANLFARGDSLAFRIAQRLRVRGGGYQLNVPVSWDYATASAGTALRAFSLAPGGRELDFEAVYSLPVLRGAGSLSGNAFLRRQPGHIAAAPNDTGAAVRLSLGF